MCRFSRIALMALVLAGGVAIADDTMTCGTKLVTVGDTKSSVLKNCGEPASRKVVVRYGDGRTLEAWIYDFGPRRFKHRVFFDGEQVKSITVVK